MPSYHKPTPSKYFHGPLYQQMHDDLQLTGKPSGPCMVTFARSASLPITAARHPMRSPTHSDATSCTLRTNASSPMDDCESPCPAFASSIVPPASGIGTSWRCCG